MSASNRFFCSRMYSICCLFFSNYSTYTRLAAVVNGLFVVVPFKNDGRDTESACVRKRWRGEKTETSISKEYFVALDVVSGCQG
jgi:hypothetical protein